MKGNEKGIIEGRSGEGERLVKGRRRKKRQEKDEGRNNKKTKQKKDKPAK